MKIQHHTEITAFLAFLFCFCGVSVTPAMAQDAALYYILDASGSMWGRASGETKIAAARGTLERLLRETPENTVTGLAVYGHRRKADCSDIEEIGLFAPLQADTLTAKIRRLSPRGKTPLADSIEFAAERIKEAPYDTTIVLISDGIETCDRDPCAVTKALKESGASFRLHVIGFGVEDEAASQLACIAQAGGGRYFKAGDSGELLSSLKQVKDSALEKRELPPPTPPAVEQKVNTTSSSLRVKARGPGRIRLILPQWVKEPYFYRLLDAESGQEKARFKELAEQIVAPGEYQLSWRQTEHGAGDVALGEAFNLNSGEALEIRLVTGFHPLPADWVPTRPYFWSLRDPESGQEVARFKGDFAPQLVPPGTYRLIYRQTEHGSSDSDLGLVEIKPDLLNEFPINSGIQLIPPGELAAPYRVKFIEIDALGKETGHSVSLAQSFGPMALKPSSYKVLYHQKEHQGSPVLIADRIDVPAGGLVELEL